MSRRKVTPAVLERMRAWKRRGRTYKLVGELCGVSVMTAHRWLTGRRPGGKKRDLLRLLVAAARES